MGDFAIDDAFAAHGDDAFVPDGDTASDEIEEFDGGTGNRELPPTFRLFCRTT